jgi:hypothetical protein
MAKMLQIQEIDPYFLDTTAAAAFLGVARKTVSNELSAGTFPVKPIYRGGKPLFPFQALREYARSLENQSSEPPKKRGRKRVSDGMVNSKSRLADLHDRKNPAGGRGAVDKMREVSRNDTCLR